MSQVKEVREFSMDHILKIVKVSSSPSPLSSFAYIFALTYPLFFLYWLLNYKVAGLLLKNYVSMLVGVLLNALDELEEGNMNYLQLQADKYHFHLFISFYFLSLCYCIFIQVPFVDVHITFLISIDSALQEQWSLRV